MTKYYIEFKNVRNDALSYDMQSKWFDTEEQAIEAFRNFFDYVSNTHVYLMSTEWDIEEDTFSDIKFEKELFLWDLN